MNQNVKIYKANEIVESSYSLTLTEQRVLLACFAQINPNDITTATKLIDLTVKDFAALFNADDVSAYEQLKKLALTLHRKELTFQGENGKVTTHWLAGVVEYRDNPCAVGVRLSPFLAPYLCELKAKFTSYRLGSVSGMTSIYGIRLYELLTQYRQFEKRKFELSELKEFLGIDADAYGDIRDFKKRVIAPAVDNVNDCSDLKITDVSYSRKGRAISDVCFFFEPAKKKAVAVKEKVIVEKPTVAESKPTESVADVIYNENVKRFGKEIADKTKAVSEGVTPKQVAGQLAAFIRHAKVN